MQKGKIYEQFINKFLKGNIVSDYQDNYDIEGRNYIYEIKGTKLQEKGKSSLGRYKIFIENHNKFKQYAEEINKKAKYGFVLQIDSRMIYKIMSWESVNLAILRGRKYKRSIDNKEVVNLSIKTIW